MVEVIARSVWGARYRAGFGTRPVRNLEVWLHHSVTKHLPASASAAQEREQMRALERIGQQRFGGGISYTFAVFPSGRVYAGTGLDRIGAHTKGHNTRGAAIVLVGNYQSTAPTKAQETAIAGLLQDLERDGAIARPVLTGGHRDVAATACPGNRAYPRIKAINKLAASSRPAKPSTPAGSPVLRYGSRSAEVGHWQKFLGITSDNSFGPETLTHTQVYQRGVGLVPDGVVGPATRAKWEAGARPKKSSLDVDGLWGLATTGRYQEVLGTPRDRVISSQASVWRARNPGLMGTSWKWAVRGATGSTAIRAHQRILRTRGFYRGAIDGLAGPLFFRALQQDLGTPADSVVSRPSLMVEELQKRLNEGKI